MNHRRHRTCAALATIFAMLLTTSPIPGADPEIPAVIFDTDIGSDCDDAGPWADTFIARPDLFAVNAAGRIERMEDGKIAWNPWDDNPLHPLVAPKPSAEEAAERIEQLMARPPKTRGVAVQRSLPDESPAADVRSFGAHGAGLLLQTNNIHITNGRGFTVTGNSFIRGIDRPLYFGDGER